MPGDRCTTAFPPCDAHRRQTSPSCLILLRRFLSPLLASGLTNCRQNRSGACHLCRVGDKIFPENPAANPRHRVAVRNLLQRRNASTADYADFADSKERNQEQHSVLRRSESVESTLSVVRFRRRLHKLNGRAI